MQFILLISCPDQPGIVAQYSGILFRTNANILSLEEHTEKSWFFMRIHVDGDELNITRAELKRELESLSSKLEAKLGIYDLQTSTAGRICKY